nr:baseplate J/gp47 family protein [Pseudoalteromonas caenipelagi]
MLTQRTPRTVQCVYCNTQAVKVQRCKPISLPLGTVPSVAAEQITAPASKIAAISKVTQPFASIVGSAAENTSQFEQRVSLRLKTKNRASSDWDYCMLARQAYNGVFYAKLLISDKAGTVTLGVVQHYTSPKQANAFTPVMPKAYQLQITDFLTAKVSAMTQVKVCNLAHETVVVTAELVVSKDANINDLNLALTAGVNIYLAPWIDAKQAQYCLNSGLSKAGLAAFIASYKEVEAIQRLDVSPQAVAVSPPNSKEVKPASTLTSLQTDTISPSTDNAIFVPASKHNFSFIRAISEANPSDKNSAEQAVTLPMNTLLEVSA